MGGHVPLLTFGLAHEARSALAGTVQSDKKRVKECAGRDCG